MTFNSFLLPLSLLSVSSHWMTGIHLMRRKEKGFFSFHFNFQFHFNYRVAVESVTREMESWAKRAMQASNTRSVHYSISSIKPRQPPCIDPLFLCKSLNISYNTCEIPPSLTPTSFSGWIAFELTTLT